MDDERGEERSEHSAGVAEDNVSGRTIMGLEEFIDESFKGFVGDSTSGERALRLEALTKGVGSPTGGGPNNHSTPRVEGKHTRSKGAVPELPYVQPRILKRQINAPKGAI